MTDQVSGGVNLNSEKQNGERSTISPDSEVNWTVKRLLETN